MYAKFLFVGLGGSGGKTLRFLKRDLKRWQAEHGIEGPLPKGWQFVNIDTPTDPDADPFHLEPLHHGEYVGLIDGGILFKDVQNNLDAINEHHHELCGWRLDPAKDAGDVPLLTGAGQFRAIGQTIGLAYARRIQDELAKRWSQLTAPDTDAELGQLYQNTTGQTPAGAADIHTVIVSSLAGGTGAGLLNTVCDILRSSPTPNRTGDRVFALLYTPDVFDALKAAVTDGIQANTLAAACELMNGAWRRDNDPLPLPDPVLRNAGLVAQSSKSGPAFPFLVGRENAVGIGFATPEETFEMTGRSLVSWVTDTKVQNQLIKFTVAGWPAFALAMPMGEILVDEGGDATGLPQFQAIGFARVSLGTDYFEDYSVARIAREANELLADYHISSPEADALQKQLAMDGSEIAREIAKSHRDSFLREAGLFEYGPDQNQIIDALRPDAALASSFESRARDLTDLTDPTDTGAVAKKPVLAWLAEIRVAVETELIAYDTAYQDALDDSSRAWIERIETSVVDAVERQLSNRGLSVAHAMCELVAEHLRREVASELRDEARTRLDWHASWQREPQRILDGLDGRVESSNAALDEALRHAVHFATFIGEALLRERAAELCEQIAERVLRPLSRELEPAHASTARDTMAAQAFPAGDAAPPKQFEPPLSEFTLIAPAEFPGLFADRLKQTYPNSVADARRARVRSEVICGEFLKSEPDATDTSYNESRCLAVHGNWWPSTKRSIDPLRNPSDLRVRVQTGIDDLQQRARHWLRRAGKPFDRLLGLGIRSYLGDDGLFDGGFTQAQIAQHRTRFVAQLNAAVSAAAPLVNIDAGLLGLVHPGTAAAEYQRCFSQIPLAGHPSRDDVSDSLQANGLAPPEIDALLTNDPAVKRVDITSLLHSPHSILVMQSLTGPVASAWGKAKGSATGRRNFWTCRRGKRLDKFVPVPQPLLLCMTRGWFTGIALGRIRKTEPVTIMRHHDGTEVKFPNPLLSPMRDGDDTLACLLESLGLAYVEAGALGVLDPLAAYKELRDLGRADLAQADLSDYVTPSAPLRSWIEGKQLESITEPHERLTESTPQDTRGRAERLASVFEEVLDRLATSYAEEQTKWPNDARSLTKAPLWTGMWPHVSLALKQLSEACEKFARGGSSGW